MEEKNPDTMVKLFMTIGQTKKNASELAERSPEKAALLLQVIELAGIKEDSVVAKPVGLLLYDAALLLDPSAARHKPVLVQYIVDGKVTNHTISMLIPYSSHTPTILQPRFALRSLRLSDRPASMGIGTRLPEARRQR